MSKNVPKKPSFLRRLALPLIAISWVAFVGYGGYLFMTVSGSATVIQADGTIHKQYATDEAGSLGQKRLEAVRDATRRYVDSHPEAPQAMREGQMYAPQDFLNEDLASHHEKFRVRSVEGAKIEFFEVS